MFRNLCCVCIEGCWWCGLDRVWELMGMRMICKYCSMVVVLLVLDCFELLCDNCIFGIFVSYVGYFIREDFFMWMDKFILCF